MLWARTFSPHTHFSSATPHAQVVFGRDLDGSNDAVKDVRDSAYFDGAAGSTTRQIHGSAHPFELPPKKIPLGPGEGRPSDPWGGGLLFGGAGGRDGEAHVPRLDAVDSLHYSSSANLHGAACGGAGAAACAGMCAGGAAAASKRFIDPPGASSAHFWGGGAFDPSFDPNAPRDPNAVGFALAGSGAGKGKRSLLGAGLSSQLSDVDEVVFGTDMDASGAAVKDPRQYAAFAGACGVPTRLLAEQAHRSQRAPMGQPSLMHAALRWPGPQGGGPYHAASY